MGQNFLADTGVADRIIGALELSERDTVIEIGPGVAALTEKLCREAGYVLAVEIDKRLVCALQSKLSGFENFKLIQGDILKIDISDVLASAGFSPSTEFKIVSNLPYYITTPIIMKILEGDILPVKMVFMMQKEVAERIVARPSTKAYSALTVAVNYYAKPSKAFSVSPHCFIPQPGVESVVVVFDPYGKPPVDLLDRQSFFKVVRAAFAQRRKQLMNCLIHAGLLPNDKGFAGQVFEEVGLSVTVRGEELDIGEFARLSNMISAGRG
ncbi:MAG: 16S rRNA (adenine(1518)-N(6)/adenine(1519)-N(6))-dimethyltransferase RsmA [Oscillospiraceae bacterium]|nr:16S rRNA (adenine(1518)-N(6)/adenine(1519)-N(6))-dimethyltransferase RsmA [Oscillospiraceae bacterium]